MTLDERANLAAQAAIFAGAYAHGARLTDDRAEKRRLLTRAFRAWNLAARQWAELEALAPNSASEGFAEARELQDVVEAT